jgi:hypothetical protein
MIEPAAAKFLAGHRRVHIFTADADGAPIGFPMDGWFTEGKLFFTTYRTSGKVANLLRDPEVCCIAITDDDDPDTACAVVQGTCRVREFDIELADWWLTRPTVDKRPIAADVKARHRDRVLNGKRVMLEITPITATRIDPVPATDGAR